MDSSHHFSPKIQEITQILNKYLTEFLGENYVLLGHGSSQLNADIDEISDYDLVLAVKYKTLAEITNDTTIQPNLENMKYNFFFEMFAQKLKTIFEKSTLMVFEIDQAKVPLLNLYYK